jgi:ABC-type sulfate transport system permease component
LRPGLHRKRHTKNLITIGHGDCLLLLLQLLLLLLLLLQVVEAWAAQEEAHQEPDYHWTRRLSAAAAAAAAAAATHRWLRPGLHRRRHTIIISSKALLGAGQAVLL